MRSCSCTRLPCSRNCSAAGTSSSATKQPFSFGSPFAARRVLMKNHFLILKVTLSVSLIVLSIAVPVNCGLARGAGWGNTHAADGVPLPPPIKPGPNYRAILTADGVPLPPPIKPGPNNQAILTADGVPLPPPIKPGPNNQAILAADGVPLPPPIKPGPNNQTILAADGVPLPP